MYTMSIQTYMKAIFFIKVLSNRIICIQAFLFLISKKNILGSGTFKDLIHILKYKEFGGRFYICFHF